MTLEEIRSAMESVFAATVQREGGHYAQTVPAGVTPMSWHEEIKDETDLAARAEGMAMAGLFYGCEHFARIRVQDRATVRMKSQGGRGIERRRPRAVIVHALGWSDKPIPEYVHAKVWPHAIGADVPESSKISKGDAQ